jgi:hypothetical protein
MVAACASDGAMVAASLAGAEAEAPAQVAGAQVDDPCEVLPVLQGCSGHAVTRAYARELRSSSAAVSSTACAGTTRV